LNIDNFQSTKITFASIRYNLLTDRQTDGRTEGQTEDLGCITALCIALRTVKTFGTYFTFFDRQCIVSLYVGCETDIRIISDRKTGPFSAGDVFSCLTPSNHGLKQSYKWTDSKGVVVSNTSTMTLTGEGSFNLTCTITDERPACTVLRASISGNITGKLIHLMSLITLMRQLVRL